MFTFATPSPTGTSCQAHFYTWTQLSELCSTLLTGFFERPTPVQAVGETNLDSWSLKFLEAPISHDDLEAIFTALQADDYDRDVNWQVSGLGTLPSSVPEACLTNTAFSCGRIPRLR